MTKSIYKINAVIEDVIATLWYRTCQREFGVEALKLLRVLQVSSNPMFVCDYFKRCYEEKKRLINNYTV